MPDALKRPFRVLLHPVVRDRVPPLFWAWTKLGRRAELGFWNRRLARGGLASRESLFTTGFGLDPSFYAGKRILAVGCGPRGELDWAETAAERVGVDPLADRFVEMIGEDAAQGMTYVTGVAERLPFEDGRFDVICSINSFDHVQDAARAAGEIRRVLAPGGTFLLATEVNHPPRLMEPQTFSWEVLDLFAADLEIRHEGRFEISGRGIQVSVAEAVPYDEEAPPHEGLLVARFEKPPTA